MPQKPLISTNIDPPSPAPLFNVVCHFSSDLMCFGISIEKGTLIVEGGGGCIACNKLYNDPHSKTTCVPTTFESHCGKIHIHPFAYKLSRHFKLEY